MTIVSLVLTWVLWLAVVGNAQDKREPIRMAVIPFEDILGNASPDAMKFTQVLLSHLSREEKLAARVAKPDKPGTVLDRETALALAKKQDAVYLITGRVIEATTGQGNSGLPIPTLGRVNSSHPIDTRLRWPPLSSWTRVPRTCERPSDSIVLSISSRRCSAVTSWGSRSLAV